MVNTLWLPVVSPHGNDNSDADVFIAVSSSGPPRMEWRLRCTTRETACSGLSSQTMMLVATHVATFTFSFRQMQWRNVVLARSTSTSESINHYNIPVVESNAPAPARTCGRRLSGSSGATRPDCASSSDAVHRQPLRFLCSCLVKAPKLPRFWGLLLFTPQSLWKWQRWGHLSLPNLVHRCVWWHLVVVALSGGDGSICPRDCGAALLCQAGSCDGTW